jgi:hypothetical protein
MKRIVSGIVLSLLLTSMLMLAFNIRTAESSDPEVLFFDDFNDGVADGWAEKVIRCYDSSTWEELPSTWSVINGEYFVTLGIIDSGISTVNDLNLTDCIIQTKLRFRETNVGFRAGIIFRFLDDKHYYTFHLTDEYDAIEFTKYGPENPSYGIAGVQVRLLINANVEYTLKVEIKGNTFIGYLNNEEIISWSDDSYTSGKVGLYARAADVFFDDFIIRPITAENYTLSVSTFKNYVPMVSNISLLDETKRVVGMANFVTEYNWTLPIGKYFVQASIFYNRFIYKSEQIQVDLTRYTKLAINFLFGNLSVSCFDIKNRPLKNCTIIFIREDEQRIHYTDNFGLTTLEAYYGNWTVKAYWMGVLVGEAKINVNQTRIDGSISCQVGDLTVIVFDQYGHPIEANVTLRNDMHDLTFSGYIRKPLENMTFTQIPLIDYNLTIKDDFGTQTYLINTEQTNQIRIETIPLAQKIIYVIIGAVAGVVIGSTSVWIVTKRKRKQ